MTQFTALGAAESSRTHAVQFLAVGFLGIFIIGFVGFSHMEVVHNAGHDYRHSMAFPCH